jgi:transcriptional regulator with XRE-family HTH domain
VGSFAERLKDLRRQAGLTQEALAKESGLPVGTIRGYEQGQREPYWHVVPKLAVALGTDCNAFAEVRRDAKKRARPSKKNKPKEK